MHKIERNVKMKRSKLIKHAIGLASIIACISCTLSFNASATTGYAYTMITNDDSGWSTDTQARQLAYYWDALGRHSYYSRDCSYSYVNSERLNSDIVVAMGHGSWECVELHYDPYVQLSAHTSNSALGYVGLQSRSLSNVDFIVFAGCETASTSHGTNISQTAINRGATTSMGFSKPALIMDFMPYVTRVAQRLANNYTVAQAQAYANSFNYGENATAKSTVIYGNANLVFRNIRSMLNENDMQNYNEESQKIFDLNGVELENNATDIQGVLDAIMDQLNIDNMDNYRASFISTSDDNKDFVLDLTEYIGETPTDNVISVVFNDNKAILARDNRIAEVNNNTQIQASMNNSIDPLSQAKTLAEKDRGEDEIIIEQTSSTYYNTAAGEMRLKLITVYQNQHGAKVARLTEVSA